jgi:hypothetical protein
LPIFLARLADDTIEAIGNAAERHHAHRHQFLLHLAVQTRLRDDGRVGVVEVLQQVLLDGGHVVDRFGHHPRQFLEAGEAVELERIEIGVVLSGLRRTRLHLQFGLDLDVAQLPTQTDDVLGQVEQRALDARISPSIRERAIDNSPASLTSRSIRSARTRRVARWRRHRSRLSGVSAGRRLP